MLSFLPIVFCEWSVLLFCVVESVCQQGECCLLLTMSEGGVRKMNMAACDVISGTPQLQPRSILPLATQKIAEVGQWPQPPGLSGGELIEPGLGEGKAPIFLGGKGDELG